MSNKKNNEIEWWNFLISKVNLNWKVFYSNFRENETILQWQNFIQFSLPWKFFLSEFTREIIQIKSEW